MTETPRHISRGPKTSGQWVPCHATACKLGGDHISSTTLKEVKQFAGRKTLSEVTGADYTSYLRHQLRSGTLAQLTPEERTQQFSQENNLDGKTTLPVSFTFTQNQWKEFLFSSFNKGVDLPLNVTKAGGAAFREGNKTFTMKDVPMRVRDENSLKELLAEISSL